MKIRTTVLVTFAMAVITAWAGVSTADAASRPQDRTVRVDGLSRRYVAWLPEGYQQRQNLPVVLAFHGAAGNPEAFADASRFPETRQGENFVIVYPEGYQATWNLEVCCGQAKTRNVDDVKFVHMLLDDLGSFVNIDRRRIYATGFSNGSLFTYYLACRMPDEIAAIAPVGGAMQVGTMSSCRRQRPVPTFHIHGLADTWAPMMGGEPVLKSAGHQPPVQQGIDFVRKLNGVQRERRDEIFRYGVDCTEYDGGRENAEVIFCKVPDLGHQWPGNRLTGRAARIASRLGPKGPPILASEAILGFFARYSIK
jgi:polyhydroxybutyrate depolymerase